MPSAELKTTLFRSEHREFIYVKVKRGVSEGERRKGEEVTHMVVEREIKEGGDNDELGTNYEKERLVS